LLHFSAVQLNSGAKAVVAADAVQVVDYVGDMTGDGVVNAAEIAPMGRVVSILDTSTANSTLSGFAAFPLADPFIFSDFNNNGNADAADLTVVSQYLAGTIRPQIPPVNPNNLALTPQSYADPLAINDYFVTGTTNSLSV